MKRANDEIDRRHLLKLGLSAGPALFVSSLLAARPAHAKGAVLRPAKARACVWIWLNGGPSHVDTFDPKPGAPGGGPFKPIKTRAAGVEICQHLPRLADRASDFALIRSMTSREGNHDRAGYLVRSGYAPTPTLQHPSLGAWAAEELDVRGLELPAFVSIGGPSMGAGFLGASYAPFVVRNLGRPIDNVELPRGVDTSRFQRRQDILTELESGFAAQTGDRKVHARQSVYANAARLMSSPALRAFDLASEPASLQAAYGDHDFGRGCLMARRLVEAGVRFVEVTLDGWDTHKDNFSRTKKLMDVLDEGASALFRDLRERDLLESTLVLMAGEFGRTPKINHDEGRDHHPQAWSAVLGGGGIRGGQVYGKTDQDGAQVIEHPVTIADFLATAANLLGIDPDKWVFTPVGRPISLTDHGRPIAALLADS